jgi:tetratricopeptide (TPR) repeat protein
MALEQTPTLALAVSNLRAGRLVASRQGFAEAFEIARRTRDPIGMAEAALGLGGMWVHEHRTFEERQGYLAKIEMARDAVRDLSPELLARLDVRYGVELVYVGKGSEQMVREAIERVRSSNDPAAEAEALSLLHHVILSPERGTERFIVAEQLMAAAARSGNEYYGALALMWHTVDLFMSGSPFAERELEALRIRSARAENLAIAFIVATLDVTLAIRSGNLTRAEELAGAAFSLGIECGDADAEAFLGGQLLCCRWLQGNSGELLAAGRRLQNSPSVHFANPLFSAAVAVMAAETGKIDESRRAIALTRAMLNMPRIAGVSSVQLSTYFALGEAAAILGDRVTARLVLEYLEPFAELPITGSLAVSCFGSTWRSIALAHRTLGNIDSAVDGWRRAIDNNIRFGHLPMVAVCLAELAEVLVDEGRDADGEAVKQLSEAIRIGTICGLSFRVERWQHLLNTVTDMRSPGGPLPSGENSGSLQRTADGWTIVCSLGSATVLLRKGMEHLAVLLQSPGRSVSIAELVGVAGGPRQLVLDTQAQHDLRNRVRDLQAELDEAGISSDSTASAAARAELDCIADEVERSTGLFRRSRAFVDDSERARTAVQKSIRRVLDEIEAQAPVLGGELRTAIRTGSRCTFVPSESLPARWVFRRADPQ